jgi:hypothetical protein
VRRSLSYDRCSILLRFCQPASSFLHLTTYMEEVRFVERSLDLKLSAPDLYRGAVSVAKELLQSWASFTFEQIKVGYRTVRSVLVVVYVTTV